MKRIPFSKKLQQQCWRLKTINPHNTATQMAQDTEELNQAVAAIAQSIRQGKVILFLGPGVYKTRKEQEPAHQVFASQLAAELDQRSFPYEAQQRSDTGYMILSYLKAKNEKRSGKLFALAYQLSDVKLKFAKFLEDNEADDSIYNHLAALPFPVVINTNPDQLLYNKLLQNNRPAVFQFYDTSNTSSGISEEEAKAVKGKTKLPDDLPQDTTIVYNIYGSAAGENLQSLILTESGYLRFNKLINQKNTEIDPAVTRRLTPDKFFLFLGFDFEQWQLKVLLSALGLPKAGADSKKEMESFSIPHKTSPGHVRYFYEEEMKFYFIDDNPEAFVAKLYQQYLKDNPATDGNTLAVSIPPPPDRPVQAVYICNTGSKADMAFMEEIDKHLEVLKKRNGYLNTWGEGAIYGGDDIEKEREKKMENAELFIVLVSADLIVPPKNGAGQKEKDGMQMIRDMQRFTIQNKKALVRLVLIRDSAAYTLPELAPYAGRMLPRAHDAKGKPLSVEMHSPAQLETVYRTISEAIAEDVYQIIRNRSNS
jgi:SIR2-like domain